MDSVFASCSDINVNALLDIPSYLRNNNVSLVSVPCFEDVVRVFQQDTAVVSIKLYAKISLCGVEYDGFVEVCRDGRKIVSLKH